MNIAWFNYWVGSGFDLRIENDKSVIEVTLSEDEMFNIINGWMKDPTFIKKLEEHNHES